MCTWVCSEHDRPQNFGDMSVLDLKNSAESLHLVVGPPRHVALHETPQATRFRLDRTQLLPRVLVDDLLLEQVRQDLVHLARVLNDVAVELLEKCSVWLG